METEHPYLSVLVALDAALLLILAGLAKRQLEWKRPALQPISRRRERPERRSVGPLPRWVQVVLIVSCLAGAVATGASLSGAVAPTAAAAYLAAAILVLSATR